MINTTRSKDLLMAPNTPRRKRAVLVMVIVMKLTLLCRPVGCDGITSSVFSMKMDTQLATSGCVEVGGLRLSDRLRCAVLCSKSMSCRSFSHDCSGLDPSSVSSCRCLLCSTGNPETSTSSQRGCRAGVLISQVDPLGTTWADTTSIAATTEAPSISTVATTTIITVPEKTTTATETITTQAALKPVCSPPPLIDRTVVTHTVTSTHDVAVYSCSVTTDIYVSGNTEVQCASGSNWGSATILCAPTACWDVHPTLGPVYAGSVSQTTEGKTCQIWADNTPQAKNAKYDNPSLYPSDNNVIAGAVNHCRIFQDGYSAVWCYWNEPSLFGIRRYSDCAVSRCVNVPGTRAA